MSGVGVFVGVLVAAGVGVLVGGALHLKSSLMHLEKQNLSAYCTAMLPELLYCTPLHTAPEILLLHEPKGDDPHT